MTAELIGQISANITSTSNPTSAATERGVYFIDDYRFNYFDRQTGTISQVSMHGISAGVARPIGNRLMFVAERNDRPGYLVWMTDGTSTGTRALDLPTGVRRDSFVEGPDGRTYFLNETLTATELWSYDWNSDSAQHEFDLPISDFRSVQGVAVSSGLILLSSDQGHRTSNYGGPMVTLQGTREVATTRGLLADSTSVIFAGEWHLSQYVCLWKARCHQVDATNDAVTDLQSPEGMVILLVPKVCLQSTASMANPYRQVSILSLSTKFTRPELPMTDSLGIRSGQNSFFGFGRRIFRWSDARCRRIQWSLTGYDFNWVVRICRSNDV